MTFNLQESTSRIIILLHYTYIKIVLIFTRENSCLSLIFTSVQIIRKWDSRSPPPLKILRWCHLFLFCPFKSKNYINRVSVAILLLKNRGGVRYCLYIFWQQLCTRTLRKRGQHVQYYLYAKGYRFRITLDLYFHPSFTIIFFFSF